MAEHMFIREMKMSNSQCIFLQIAFMKYNASFVFSFFFYNYELFLVLCVNNLRSF